MLDKDVKRTPCPRCKNELEIESQLVKNVYITRANKYPFFACSNAEMNHNYEIINGVLKEVINPDTGRPYLTPKELILKES